MKILELLKSTVRKFKNRKGSKETATQEPKISSREEANKLLEITIEQQPTVVTAKTTTAKDENSKEVHERPLTQQQKVITINPELKAKLVDDLVWEEECKDSLTIPLSIGDSEIADNQLIYEKSATASIETAIQEPNAPDSPSSAEPCFDSKENSADEKSSIQPIVAGVVGAALLVSSIVAYISKMYAIAVIVGIVGV